jgi:hypothetical protein
VLGAPRKTSAETLREALKLGPPLDLFSTIVKISPVPAWFRAERRQRLPPGRAETTADRSKKGRGRP